MNDAIRATVEAWADGKAELNCTELNCTALSSDEPFLDFEFVHETQISITTGRIHNRINTRDRGDDLPLFLSFLLSILTRPCFCLAFNLFLPCFYLGCREITSEPAVFPVFLSVLLAWANLRYICSLYVLLTVFEGFCRGVVEGCFQEDA